MTDEIIVDVDPELGDVETETPETETETSTPEILEPEKAEKSKELQSALAQKEHWRKKFEQVSKSAPKPTPKTDDEWKNKVEFLIKNREFNEEEFDHLANVSTRKGVSLEEAAKTEEDYINFRRQKSKNENKTPLPSQANYSVQEKKIDPTMKPEDVDKILEERFNKAQGENTGY